MAPSTSSYRLRQLGSEHYQNKNKFSSKLLSFSDIGVLYPACESILKIVILWYALLEPLKLPVKHIASEANYRPIILRKGILKLISSARN